MSDLNEDRHRADHEDTNNQQLTLEQFSTDALMHGSSARQGNKQKDPA